MHCWIQFACILLRIFVSMFIRDISMYFTRSMQFQTWPLGGVLRKKWHPAVGYTCVRLYTGTSMTSVPLALTLKSHNSMFPHISWVCQASAPPPETRWVCASKSVHRPFKWTIGFSTAFCFTGIDRKSLLIFTVKCCRNFSPYTGPLGWGAWCRAGIPPSSGRPPLPRCPFWCSTTICGFVVSLFCVCASPTSLDVTSVLYPWL